MEKYIDPEIRIVSFDKEDIIVTSGEDAIKQYKQDGLPDTWSN